ncbi:MAG TPA: hypothetical protein P5509_12370, partial [Bacteroidales bacterium]|nr:hypothetical protein [Bacteroidales bacterium]
MLVGDKKSRHKEQHPPKTRKDFRSPGRIWEKNKIISFWRLDDKLTDVIKDVNTVLNDIGAGFQIDSSWKIEVAQTDHFEKGDIETMKYLLNLFNFAKKEKNGKVKNYDCEWEKITTAWVNYTSSHTSLDSWDDEDGAIGW